MPTRLDTRHFFVIVTLTALVVLFVCVNVYLPSSKTLLAKYLIVENVSPRTLAPQRKGLLIVGQGRSGTSFVSKMFANGERIFEVYEPLRFHNLTNAEKMEVLQAFLTCKFTASTLWQKDYFPPFWHLSEKSYYIKPPENRACVIYKTGRRACFPADILVQRFIDKCKHTYGSTVVKELTNRIPGARLSSLIPLLIDPTVGADIRLLHVVRDPRASINSRIKLKWFPEYDNPQFEQKVRGYCDLIFKNIVFGQTLDESVKLRYYLILYRDIAARPIDTARKIFNFAKLDMTEKTLEWITNMTNPNKTEAKREFKRPYSLVRDSEANIEKWRLESPPERTHIIERVCQPLLELIEKISFERDNLLGYN